MNQQDSPPTPPTAEDDTERPSIAIYQAMRDHAKREADSDGFTGPLIIFDKECWEPEDVIYWACVEAIENRQSAATQPSVANFAVESKDAPPTAHDYLARINHIAAESLGRIFGSEDSGKLQAIIDDVADDAVRKWIASKGPTEEELESLVVESEPTQETPPTAAPDVPADVPTEGLNGKTPWEFACAWYTKNEIASSIRRRRLTDRFDPSYIPHDMDSEEFAEWLTNQYRLAMQKGIEIGQRAASTDRDDLKRELEGMRAEIRGVKGFAGWDREDSRCADDAAAEMRNQITQLEHELTEQAATITRLEGELEQVKAECERLRPKVIVGENDKPLPPGHYAYRRKNWGGYGCMIVTEGVKAFQDTGWFYLRLPEPDELEVLAQFPATEERKGGE